MFLISFTCPRYVSFLCSPIWKCLKFCHLAFFPLSILLVIDGSTSKLGTIDGVFIPTWLSIWGILLFLRLGFCVGQAGLWQTLSMLSIGYIIAFLTTLSIAAISSNGIVKVIFLCYHSLSSLCFLCFAFRWSRADFFTDLGRGSVLYDLAFDWNRVRWMLGSFDVFG
jgi:hypothetical protein